MEAKIAGCKDAFNEEMDLLNSQLEEEWETGRRDKEERRKITKKASGFECRDHLFGLIGRYSRITDSG